MKKQAFSLHNRTPLSFEGEGRGWGPLSIASKRNLDTPLALSIHHQYQKPHQATLHHESQHRP